jgi:hypothetical protein
MSSPAILAVVAVALMAAPGLGFAQSPSSTAPIPPASAGAAPSPSGTQAAPAPATTAAATTVASAAASAQLSPAARAVIEERIAKLRTELGITPTQMPLWSAFAQAMLDNAAATNGLFAERAVAVKTMNAVENMHSYAQIARAYADNTERLATAFDSLYASLSDVQKRAADMLFRQQAMAAAQPRGRR